MITIPMNDNGPDMDLVEKLVNEDEAVKGIQNLERISKFDTDKLRESIGNLRVAAAKYKDISVDFDSKISVPDDTIKGLSRLERLSKFLT